MKTTKLQSATKTHYEHYPFDYDTADRRQRKLESTLIGELIRSGLPGAEVIGDIGGGSGFIAALVKEHCGREPVVIDLSLPSLRNAREKGLTRLCNASNLELPIKTEAIDFVISNGVIHHTPEPRRSFGELARVLRRGGRLYLSVYNRWSLYFCLFVLTAPLRWYRRAGGPDLLLKGLVLPPFCLYWLGGMWIVGCQTKLPPWRRMWHLFNDQIMTPRATFHTFAQIERWAVEEGLRTRRKQKETASTMLALLFEKKM